MAVNKVVYGTTVLVDLTGDTVTSDKLMQGYTAHDKSGALITGTATGGGVTQDADGYLVLDEEGGGSPSPTPSGASKSDPIRFFDYDGTLVASYTSVPSSLPANPSHEGLVAQGWNWSLEDIATQFASSGTCDVGQMYTTSDGRTRIYVTVSDITKSFWLGLAPKGTLSIDWGDGSESSSMTGTSYTTIKTVQHTYATADSYVISVEAESGGFAFYGTSTNYTRLLNKYESASSYYNRAYGGCVTAVELGDGAMVGDYAFSLLFNMRTVTIPDTVTNIGIDAFYGCYALESVTIPDGVTSINSYAFYNCYALESIIIPDGVTSIRNNVFTSCYALESITIPDGVTSIGSSMFYNCYALESITIPGSVTSIGSTSFISCVTLKSVTVPNTVTSIGSSAFSGCYALESVTIPDGVTSIGSSAFNCCYALESVTIPDGVTSIGSSMFYNCFTLKSVTVPNTVTSIESGAFYCCYNMDEYHFLPTTPPTLMNADVFSRIQSGCKMYVPYSADHSILEAYKTATNWSTYASYMVEEEA